MAQPGYGQFNQGNEDAPHTTFNVVEGDYRCSCVGSCCFPCCGLVATLCCCNTLSGKHGVAEGCKISFMISILISITVGILVVAKTVDCKKDLTAKNTKDKKCTDIKGATWNPTTKLCEFNGKCPKKYEFQSSVKDGVAGWCKNKDHYTCLGQQFKQQPWVALSIEFVLLSGAIYFARHYYNLRLQQSGRVHV